MIKILVCFIIGCVGYFIGTVFKICPMYIISGISVLFICWAIQNSEGFEGLPGLIISICLVIINISMWMTWYFTTDQTFIGTFLKKYIIN